MLGIFLDTETTGLNPFKHQPIEIALKILDLLSGMEKETYHTIVFHPYEIWKQSDPESLRINGFCWEEVSKGQPIEKIKQDIESLFQRNGIKRGEAVFICQNPSFDRAFFGKIIDPDHQERLHWPYHWLDLASMYWIEGLRRGKTNPSLFPWKTGLSKDRIAATYHLEPEAAPHRAMRGVDHLILCYRAVVGFPF